MKRNDFIEALRASFTDGCEIHTIEKIESDETGNNIVGLYDLGDVESAVAFFEENYTEDMVRIGLNHNTTVISFEIRPIQANEE
jgi:hypothetical protein